MTKSQCYRLYRHYLKRTYDPMPARHQCLLLFKAIHFLERAETAPRG